jgi:hypothetical protein
MSSSTPPSARGAASQTHGTHWIAHVALVLVAALVTVVFPSLITEFSRPIDLVLWTIVVVSVAFPMFIGIRRLF